MLVVATSRKVKEVTHPLAPGNKDIDPLKAKRPETSTILDVVCDREGMKKGEDSQQSG